jgi:hypothetical protein
VTEPFSRLTQSDRAPGRPCVLAMLFRSRILCRGSIEPPPVALEGWPLRGVEGYLIADETGLIVRMEIHYGDGAGMIV